MGKKDKPSNFRLRSELERAVALLKSGRFAEAVGPLRALAPTLPSADGYKLLVHALQSLGREAEAVDATVAGAERFPNEPDLALRAGLVMHERGDYPAAAKLLGGALELVKQEPEALARYAHALLELGKADEASGHAEKAFRRRPSQTAALVHGLVSLHRGHLDKAADGLTRAANSLEGAARLSAESMLGLAQFWRGHTRVALELWKPTFEHGALESAYVPFLAVAAAIHGDEPLARAALDAVSDPNAPASLLARGRVEIALNRPEAALEPLDKVPADTGELYTLAAASRGRALRMLGRDAEADAVLSPLVEKLSGALAGMVLTDLGRIASDRGQHEQARELFERALKVDHDATDAKRGLALAAQRTAWREATEKSAQSQVEAARAEAEAMRRAFADRERELELLRARLAAMEKAATEAARQAEQARVEAEATRRRAVEDELRARETDVDAKAGEALQQAFGEGWAKVPRGLRDALTVAERTWQKALYTELPAAAIAVLYAGALERGLLQLLVVPFDRSLGAEDRKALLHGAARERRAGKVEYFDKFVEAFDREKRAKAPSLGEIARVIGKRNEPHLAPFGRFLAQGFSFDAAFLDALSAFVLRAKEQLRDPVAHGRAVDLPQAELGRFRKELLFDLAGSGVGALPALVLRRR